MRKHHLIEAIHYAPLMCKTCPVLITIVFALIIYGCSTSWSIVLPDGQHTEGHVDIESANDTEPFDVADN